MRKGLGRVHFLVVRLGALGDVVNTLPAVTALRRAAPKCRISWVTEQPAYSLVECIPDVDQAILLPRKRWQADLPRPWHWPALAFDALSFFRELRREKPDIVLDFQSNLRSGLVARLSGSPRRIGFDRTCSREYSHLLATEHAAVPEGPLHRVEKHLRLVQHLFPDAAYEPPRIDIPPSDEHATDEFLAPLRQDRPGPLVVIHPGASVFGLFKRWPAERFGQVAAALHEQENGTVVLTWGPGERDIAAQAQSASRGRAVLALPTPRLGRLAALLRRADLVIGGDTGPLHLAAALGAPVVGIYGPKDPRIYGPYGRGHAVVRRNLPCSPCTKRRCPRMECITSIKPDDVLEAAEGLLARA